MDLDAQGFGDGLKGWFADLSGPRNEKSCEHWLFDNGALAVLSVACGADDRCDIATFARVKLDRLKTFLALPWTFVRVEGVEPTNNDAERALRHGVISRKLSGGTDSESGSRFVERMLSVVATCRQQDINVLDYLTRCYQAHRDGKPAPSLLSSTSTAQVA